MGVVGCWVGRGEGFAVGFLVGAVGAKVGDLVGLFVVVCSFLLSLEISSCFSFLTCHCKRGSEASTPLLPSILLLASELRRFDLPAAEPTEGTPAPSGPSFNLRRCFSTSSSPNHACWSSVRPRSRAHNDTLHPSSLRS